MDSVTDKLKQLGFYKFQLAGDNQLAKLRSLYVDYTARQHPPETGMSVSHNQGNPEQNLELSKSIESILAPGLNENFPGYRFFLGHFVVKAANCGHSFQLHQDWNVVNESIEQSIQVWVPLELSYPENGGLCFVPRSHLFGLTYRSGSFGLPRVNIKPALHPYLSYVRLFPGEAAAFYNSLLHGSFSNATDTDRVSVLVNLVPQDSPTCYFHLNEEAQQLEVYEVNAETLLKHLPDLEKGALPFTKPIAAVPTTQTKQRNELFNDDQLVALIRKDRKSIDKVSQYEFKQDPIIKNPTYEQEINEAGYTVIDFLDNDLIQQLKVEFSKFFPDRSLYKGRYNSLDNLDDAGRLAAHELIVSTIKPKLDALFKDYICPISVLYSKRNDGVADTDWHTDPHFVFNQHLESLYTLWCPLQDVDDNSGVLNVIPYSHRLSYKITNPNYAWDLEAGRNIFNKFKKTFHLKAGQAIFFDSRLIHGSPPNVSDIQRDCIVLRVAHKHSKFVSITPSKEQKSLFEVYQHNADFFMGNTVKKHNECPTTGVFAGIYRHFSNPLSADEIEKILAKQYENTKPRDSRTTA
jgi:ectoine hydroxylase-related dioxygenase (phytanoyl-CoA dioxygenase family)